MRKLYKQNVRMNSIAGVNRVMQRTINGLIQDEIEEDKARTIGYLCNILIRGLEKGDLEERIEELEKSLESQKVG